VGSLPWAAAGDGRGGRRKGAAAEPQQNLRKSCSSPCLLGKKQRVTHKLLATTGSGGLEDKLSQGRGEDN
jgi:hypothetical protein